MKVRSKNKTFTSPSDLFCLQNTLIRTLNQTSQSLKELKKMILYSCDEFDHLKTDRTNYLVLYSILFVFVRPVFTFSSIMEQKQFMYSISFFYSPPQLPKQMDTKMEHLRNQNTGIEMEKTGSMKMGMKEDITVNTKRNLDI